MPLPPLLSRCSLFLSAFLFSFLMPQDRLTASGVFFPPPSATSVVTVPFFLAFFLSFFLFLFLFWCLKTGQQPVGFSPPPPLPPLPPRSLLQGHLPRCPERHCGMKRTCQKMETYINGTEDSYRDLYRWDQRLS